MESLDKTKFFRGPDIVLIAGMFFSCFFFYLWQEVNPSLIYFAFGDLIDFPEFLLDISFLKETINAPGGTADYLGNFLSQFFYYPSGAAIIITAIIFAYWACTYLLIATVSNVRSRCVGFLPSVWIVMLWSHYNHPMNLLLALLASLVFSVVWFRFHPERKSIKIPVFAVMFIALYYICAGASLIFALLVAIQELLVRRWFVAISNLLITVAVVFLIGVRVYDLDVREAFLKLIAIFPIGMNLKTVSLLYLYMFFPVVIVIYSLSGRFFSKKTVKPKPVRRRTKKQPEKKPHSVFASRWLPITCSYILLGALSVTGAIYSFDSNKKHMLTMNVLLQDQQWGEYLKAAKEFEKGGFYNGQVNHDVNRALYRLGRLTDEMFSHMQSSSGLVLSAEDNIRFSSKFLRVIDMYYELGNLNEAEHWAYEILESEGRSPRILKKLADINIVKGQVETARVFLNVLSKDIIFGDYAAQRLKSLDADPDMKSDPDIQRQRGMLLARTQGYSSQSMEKLCLDLLEQNPKNRMACEYLMTLFLLTRNNEKIAANIHRLREAGYDRLPTHLEESILIHLSSGKQVDLDGWTISQNSQGRFRKYLEIYKRYKGNKQAAIGALAQEFGNTYYFYSMFNISGVGR